MTETPTTTAPSNGTVQETDEILAALISRISPVGDTRPNLKILIYSEAGAGKTTWAAGAPNNLIIDAEDGLASIRNHPELVKDSVQRYPYKSFEGTEKLIQYLHEGNPAFSSIETVTIDSLSELHKKGLAETTEREWKKNPLANNRYVAETEHHTENNEHIRRLVSSLKDLDRNLILISHARTVEPKGKPAKTYPDFSEKLANTIAGIVDIVAYIDIREIDGETKRVFRFHTDGSVMAKTRIGGLPEEAANVTWDSLWDAFQKHLANK